MALDLNSWTTVDGRNPANQLIGSLSHYLQDFIHPRWCRISSINSINTWFLAKWNNISPTPPFPWFLGVPLPYTFHHHSGGPTTRVFCRDEIFDQDLMMVKPSPGWTINLKWVGWICSITSLVKHTKPPTPLSFPADNTRTRGSSWCGIVQVSNLENHLHVHLRYSIITLPEVDQWIPWKVTISQKDRIHSKPSSFRGYVNLEVCTSCFWNHGSMASLRICIYTHQLNHLDEHVRILIMVLSSAHEKWVKTSTWKKTANTPNQLSTTHLEPPEAGANG